MESLSINVLQTINKAAKLQLFELWNKECPEQLIHKSIQDFESYLIGNKHAKNFIVTNELKEIVGWAIFLERDIEIWFAIIISSTIQGKGIGKQLIDVLKQQTLQLNGWVIDHEKYKKIDGSTYKSPLNFYKKCGFTIIENERLENEKLSAVKIQWKK